jgi:nucleotide-binding universal stress UspA family protein
MYASLLVPLDGSAFAEQALPFALSIARRAGAVLNVAQVHVPFALMFADSMSSGSYDVEARVIAQERDYLDGIVNRLKSQSQGQVVSDLLEGPDIAEKLNEHATATKADLVVMTTHGRGPLSRFWLGSVADGFVRIATIPVLLVRPQENSPDLASEPVLRHMLIPLDGSALAERILEPATALGKLLECDYTLLRAYGPEVNMNPLGEMVLNQLESMAQNYLDQTSQRLKALGLKVQARIAHAQHPASAIIDAAQKHPIDLIAMATHGRRGLPRLLLGSVADKVIRGASIPLLTHRAVGVGGIR